MGEHFPEAGDFLPAGLRIAFPSRIGQILHRLSDHLKGQDDHIHPQGSFTNFSNVMSLVHL